MNNGTMPARRAAELQGHRYDDEPTPAFNVGGIHHGGEYARVMAAQEAVHAVGNIALRQNLPANEQ